MLRILLILFVNVIIARAGKSSLSFVIDNSGSMGEEIDQVRRGARSIMDIILNYKSSQIEDIVLVTFNDPVYLNEMKIKTRDPDKLQGALNSIQAFNYRNRDWEEFSLSGIELALNHSQPNSYLFVFTDASAKDFDKVELIKGMCQKAQTQILFILTDYCGDNYDIKCKVYHEIAVACSGQVFIVDKNDIYKVIDYIKETVKGDKSIIKTSEVPANKKTKIQFEVDDKTEYVLISAAGENVRITNKEGPSSNYKTVLSTDNTQALRLEHPATGTYSVTVHGTSQVTVHVFSRTDFVFEHGFSKLMPKSVSDTSKQPIAGSKSYLAIHVTDPDHEVEIQNAIIMDTNGVVLHNLSLRKVSNDFYTTEQFISPNQLFQIAVTGKVHQTRKEIKRFAKTLIQPQKPEIIPIKEMAPGTRITEGSHTNVTYKGTLQLSCAVSGYPEPNIVWKDDNGKVLPSKSSAVEPPYKYISYLTINNVINSGVRYVCIANNKLSSHQSTVNVEVLSPFSVEAAPPGISNIRYNKEAIIQCKIKSNSRMRISWFRKVNNNDVQLISSDKYGISSDGIELKIKSVALDSAGQYTCKAVLIDDPSQQKELTTNVKVTIDEKAPTASITEGPNVQVPYDGKLRLTCIITAYPAPKVIWKNVNGKVFPSQVIVTEPPYKYKSILRLNKVKSVGSGYYCTASNKLSSQESEVVHAKLLSPFTVAVETPATTPARYGHQTTIRCDIKSSSRMRIDWFRKRNIGVEQIVTSNKYIISSDGTELTIKSVALKSAGQYTCKAVLVDDPSQHIEFTTNVNVAVDDKTPVSIINGDAEVPYNGTLQLTCAVSAYPEPKIIWRDENRNILPSKITLVELPYKYKSDLTVYNVRSNNSYYCEAINKLSTYKSRVLVTVLSPYTVGSALPVSSTARYGHWSVIKCDIKSPSPMRIDWFRKINNANVEIKTSAKYTISSDGTELKIKSVILDSAGQYTCKAVLVDDPSQHQEFTTNVNVAVDDKTPVSIINGDAEVPYNGTLQLTCSVSAYPEPKIIWRDENRNILPSRSSQVELPYKYKSDLTVYNVRSKNSYYCEASNTLSTYKSKVHVTVLSPYRVGSSLPGSSTARYGHESVIKCDIKSSSPMRIDWFRKINNGIVQIKTAAKFKISSDGSELTIKSVTLESAGQYTCKAVLVDDPSQHLEFTTNVNVAVDDKTPVSIINGDAEVPYNGTLQLTCSVSAYPEPKIIWRDENRKVLPSKSSPVELPYKYKSDLTVYNVRSQNSYYCEASNTLSTYKSRVQVTVLSPYSTGTALPVSSTARYGHDSVIKCDIKSSSPMRIDWFRKKNNDKVELKTSAKYTISSDGTELKIKSVALESAGHYTCKAVLIDDPSQHMEFTTNVNVAVDDKAPITSITEGSHVQVPYNGTLQLSCTVTAYPAPKIIWMDGKHILASKTLPLELPYNYISHLTLHNVVTNGTGYVCRATNKLTTTESAVNVGVLSPFTNVVAPPDNTTALYGREALIKCKITSSSPIQIKWFKKVNRNVLQINKSDNMYTISSDQTELKIDPVTLDTAGQYMCKAVLLDDKNQHLQFFTDVVITDLASPIIEKSTSILIQKASSPTVLRCKLIQGYPKPVFTWQFEGRGLNNFVELSKKGEEFKISYLTLKDAGIYQCIAKNVLGGDKHQIELIVEAPPTVELEHGDKSVYSALEGDKVLRIPCNAVGYPKPEIVWYKMDKIIIPDEKISMDYGTLVIKNPISKDNGEYKCTAKNKFGEVSQPFEVIVTPFIDIEDDLNNSHNIYILEKESKNIKCLIANSSNDDVRWYLNGVGVNVTGTFYPIINAKQSDDGNYTCRVNTQFGSTSDNYEVDVGYPPTFKISSPKNIEWNGDDGKILDCSVQSKPYPEIKWLYNGKIMNVGGSTQLSLTKWGKYVCEVSNPHDTIRRSFEVSSSACLIDTESLEELHNIPLVLSENADWPQFETIKNRIIVVPTKYKLTLSCHNIGSKQNVFQKFPGKSDVIAICDHDDNFLVDGTSFKLSDFTCKEEVSFDVVKTGTVCTHENSELIKVGFNLDHFVEVYRVCYDKEKNVPVYAQVEMSSTNSLSSAAAHRWFKYPGVADGSPELKDSCGRKSSCCYGKSQLINARDVSYGPPQKSTFIEHLNSIELWHPCDRKNTSWLFLENLVRTKYGEDAKFSVLSGASEYNMTSDGANIPRYLWKVFQVAGDPLAVVFINDEHPQSSDVLCDNICANNDLPGLTGLTDDYTYCCEIEEFTLAFGISLDNIFE